MKQQKQSKAKVAILLAAYNGMKYLDKQVSSILDQQNTDITLYINIDKSEDGTEEYIGELADKNKNIKVLAIGKKFKSASKNFYHLIKNIEFKNYDFIGLADQDDIWDKKKIISAIEKLNFTESDGYSSNVTAFWGNKKTIKINKSQKQKKYDYYFESPGPGCTFLMRNKLVVAIQKFILSNEILVNDFQHHDWFLYAYARKNGFKWCIDKRSFMLYRQHESNELGVNIGLKAFLKRLKQVFSGEAVRKHLQLSQMLDFKTFKISNSQKISRSESLNFFFNAELFRRKKSDQIYFRFYWFFALIFGLNEKKLNLNILFFFNILIAISSIFIIFLIVNNDNSQIKFYNLISFSDLIIIIFIATSYNIITSKRIITALTLNNNSIGFINWNNFFVQGQILGYLVPQSGIIYRAFILKQNYSLSYSKYVGIYIFLITSEIFILSFILIASIIYFDIYIVNYFGVILIPFIYMIIFLLFILLIIFKFSFVKNIIKKIQFKWIRSFLLKTQIIFLTIFKKKKVFYKILFYSFLKIIFGVVLFLFVLSFLVSVLGFQEAILFFSINQLFEPLKITPQNLGVTELILGFAAVQMSLSVKIGIFSKVILRIVDMISLILMLIFHKILQILLYQKKNSLI